ncbi:GMP reductase 2, partial [Fragariocoptes setiger]
MDTIGTFEMAKSLASHEMFTAVHKHYTVEEWLKFASENSDILNYVAVSCGIGSEDNEKLAKILDKVPAIKFICIDVANGYSDSFVRFVEKARHVYPSHTIMAGNVVTGKMTKKLLLAGADIIKVGIGPGSVCTTRRKTGVGCPQLSAVLDCSVAAHELGGHIISDGGCTSPGDICKAFGAGADFVMLGGMLAGHDQCQGELIIENGRKYVSFYGMSSRKAQEKYNNGLASYRASEGKVVKVPYRGDVTSTIHDILGGLRSMCSYIGAFQLSEAHKRCQFAHVFAQTNEVFTPFDVEK